MASKPSRPKRSDITTIQISKETKKKLQEKGKKGDTYDKIINNLLQKNI